MKDLTPTDKTAKFEAVSKAILELLNQSGVSGVSHTKVARLSKVSRPWIYKYVGKTTHTLIEFSAIHFGNQLLQVGKSSRTASTTEELMTLALQSSWLLLEKFTDQKEILPIYFRYAGTKNPIGIAIDQLENNQLKEMTGTLAIRMGVGFRYSQLGLKMQNSLLEKQKSLRRLYEYSAIILKNRS
ncbi:MAG: hypothetical protein KA715_14780 [Xanthomonadaceae bacterium]|nr:hypothetical protein [Xanthomonadaceae bacterium]